MHARSTSSDATPARSETLRERCAEILREEAQLREGGGKAGLDRQRKLGRLPRGSVSPELRGSHECKGHADNRQQSD